VPVDSTCMVMGEGQFLSSSESHLWDALIHIFQGTLGHAQAPERDGLMCQVTPWSQNCSPTLWILLVCGRSWVPVFRLADPGVQDVHLEGGSRPREGSAPFTLSRVCPVPSTLPHGGQLYLRSWSHLSLSFLQFLGARVCPLAFLDAGILSHYGSGPRSKSGTTDGQPCPCPHHRAGSQAGPGDCSQAHIGIGGLRTNGEHCGGHGGGGRRGSG
jgi:hypothetical protein